MEERSVIYLPEMKWEEVDSTLEEWDDIPLSYRRFLQENRKAVSIAMRRYFIQWVYFDDNFFSVEISKKKEREIMKKRLFPFPEAREVELEVNWENIVIDALEVLIGQ